MLIAKNYARKQGSCSRQKRLKSKLIINHHSFEYFFFLHSFHEKHIFKLTRRILW